MVQSGTRSGFLNDFSRYNCYLVFQSWGFAAICCAARLGIPMIPMIRVDCESSSILADDGFAMILPCQKRQEQPKFQFQLKFSSGWGTSICSWPQLFLGSGVSEWPEWYHPRVLVTVGRRYLDQCLVRDGALICHSRGIIWLLAYVCRPSKGTPNLNARAGIRQGWLRYGQHTKGLSGLSVYDRC